MARTGCGSHGSIPLRLHQRKGSLAGADLAGTVRAIRLPAEAGDCQARFPGRAGSLTGAVLPRPPRRLCLQRHDTARDKVIFACGPCRSVALQGMRPQSPADRRIWSVPCRGALPRGTNLRAGRSTTGNATNAEEDQRSRGTRTGCSAPLSCDELAINPQRIVGGMVLPRTESRSRCVVSAGQRCAVVLQVQRRPGQSRADRAGDPVRWIHWLNACAVLRQAFPCG